MIQRVQSIYLFLASISAALLFLLDMWIIEVDSEKVIYSVYYNMPLMILACLMILMPFIALFLYKNRKQQIRFCQFTITLAALFIGVAVYVHSFSLAATAAIHTYGFGIVIPFFVILFIYLAMRSIRKDEKLVRSMDRLR